MLQARINIHGRCSPCKPLQALPTFQELFSRISGSPAQQVNLLDSEPKLTQWLKDRGYAVNQHKVTVQQIEGQGRGLVATSAVRKGELLLTIPGQLVISPHRAAAESCLSQLLSKQSEQLSDWSLLVLFLAEQQYWHGKANSDTMPSSAFDPYMDVLPRSPIGTVLDWTQKEIEILLAGSGLQQKAHEILSAADALWQDLQPIISTAQQQGLCPTDMYSKHDISWAIGICLSRSVRLDARGGEVVLVPYADFFNHDTNCEAFLVWDVQQNGIVLRADRYYKPGEQVFISYGPKSSGELLLSYGFCPPFGSNPHDAAHLTFTIAPTESLQDAKQAALAARGIPANKSFALRIDSLPDGLLQYLAFCVIGLPSVQEVEQLAEQLFDKGKLPVVHGVSCEQIALEALAKHCKTSLKGYPQKQERDKALAATIPNGGGFEQREALMAAVRVRERQILSRTEFVAQQRVKQLKKNRG